MSQEVNIRAYIKADKDTGQMCLFIVRDELVAEDGKIRLKGVYAASGFVWEKIPEGSSFTHMPSVCRLGDGAYWQGGTATI